MSDSTSRMLVALSTQQVSADNAADTLSLSWLPRPLAADPPGPDPIDQDARQRLEEWLRMARGAFSENTWRAWACDWKSFLAFTERSGYQPLPATPEGVRGFVFDRMAGGSRMASLRRMRSTIGRVHRAAGCPDPTQSEAVRLALRECAALIGNRPEQARGLLWAEIETYLQRPAIRLRDVRDRALVCIAYDGSLRPEEIVAVDWEHLCFADPAPATLLLPKSKIDQGSFVPINASTVKHLKGWLHEAGIQQGAVFRRVIGHDTLAERLTVQSVSDIFQRIGKSIGLPLAEWAELSGHSARVGSAQDLFAANMALPVIMQQGRWKDARMPMRYGEQLSTTHGAMIRLAKE
jgi:integrase